MLELKNVCKKYKTGDLVQVALDNVSLSFRENEFVAILGPSGSGKTTLLNIVGGLDRYDSGDLIINGVSTKKYKDKDWDSYRNHTIGFVFQSYNLIPHQNILQNVELALTISNVSRSKRKQMAVDALKKVGLGEQIHKKPNQLSGGQMQRVAIARALVNNPDVILADEPTGALDSKTSVQVMDLLKEVAEDKLVIMVTHNPDLAKEYATRIVNVKDGKIISDSDPVIAGDLPVVNMKTPKTGLGFLTALSLSLNNLMTKKGRTFLTSFAGAIGIIGIALILSLSNGVNDYIRSQETAMLGSYPIDLEKETMDLTSMMEQGQTNSENAKESMKENDDDKIHTYNVVGDAVKTTENMMVENNLTAFKKYLNKHIDEIKDCTTAIEYGYNIEPVVYRNDKKAGIVDVYPASLISSTNASSIMNSYNSSIFSSVGVSSNWAQLVTSQTLRDDQYELLEGEWPESSDEIAIILNSNNQLTDYTMYTLGLIDYTQLDEIIDAAKDDKEYEEFKGTIEYKDVIGKSYKVFAPYQMYKKVDDVWVDKSEDESYIKSQLSNALNVKVTCVLKAKDDAEITTGVGYDISLTEKMISMTADSQIVKEQLANPDTNVLTGKKFEDDSDSSAKKTSAVTGDTQVSLTAANLGTAAKLQLLENETTEETDDSDTSTFDPSSFTPEQIQQILAAMDPDALQQYVLDNMNTDQLESLVKAALENEDVKKTIVAALGSDTMKTILQDVLSDEDVQKALLSSMDQDELEKMILSQISAEDLQKQILGNLTEDQLKQMMLGSISEDQLKAMILSQISQEDLKNMIMSNIDIQAMMEEYMKNMDISDLLDEDMLEKLMAEYSNSTPSTYDDVLSTLGYYTLDEPSSIEIYPVDFDAKEKVEDFIEKYNDQVNNEDDKVTYNDIIGTLTASITNIIDTISYILIAFVAISLIVSSIMIAIITYISVLERTKEIGVLRALGASKGDISKIFNAETFIEGFFSGLIGIITTLLLTIPINHIVLGLTGVDNIAVLPMKYGIILIAISVVLTLIAGFLPSRIAAKKDPVIALRTE